ncbi:MAG: ubiquinone/menaquinone biosynthesis methyltransferase [Alphaproteobacteria bacterium]|nr:ubiquinone/menaquinone biosynthesis methyltransferase [Alphaproteobacteria bacterium]
MAKTSAKAAARPARNPEQSWFGARPVAGSEKTGMVRGVFTSVAGRYDLMNDLMSLGIHRLWKDRFVASLAPRAGETILDLAGGTGDIALRILARTRGAAKLTVCDINPAMLARGKARALDTGRGRAITWLTGDAAKLPLPDNSFDAVTIAFGLRNVTYIDDALAEVARVLKIGGRFFCLEFSPGAFSGEVDTGSPQKMRGKKNPVAREISNAYDLYSFKVLPWLGEVVAHDRAAYQYLAESIRQFPKQAELAARMERAGLCAVRWADYAGGIAAAHTGWKA